MNFKNEELQIIKMLSKGYVIPLTIYNKQTITNLLSSTFLMDKKSIKLIKNYTIELEDVFCATIDTRFDIETISKNDQL